MITIIQQSRMFARSLFLLWILTCVRAVAERDRASGPDSLLSSSRDRQEAEWGDDAQHGRQFDDHGERRETGPFTSVRESGTLEEDGGDSRPENTSLEINQNNKIERRLPVHDVDSSPSEHLDADDGCDDKAPQKSPIYVWPPSVSLF
jgi:hypothetical protein